MKTLAELADAYSEALDHDRNADARDISESLITELELAGAVTEAKAVTVGRWAYWVGFAGRNHWVERKPVTAENRP